MTLKEIYERKRNAYATWRGIMDTAEKESRALTAEEKATCDKCEVEVDQCDVEIAA